jgi:hypothetical protein
VTFVLDRFLTCLRAGPRRTPIAAALALASVFAIGAPFGAYAQTSDPIPSDPLPEPEEDPGDVELFVFEADGSSQATGIVTQTTVGNAVESGTEDTSVSFVDGGNNNRGLFAINQDAGVLNQQANIVAIAVDGGNSGTSATMTSVSVKQTIADNTVIDGGGAQSLAIVDAFNGSYGIAQINQSTGALNQQVNIATIALGSAFEVGPTPLLSDAELGGVGGLDDNELIEPEETQARTILIENSLQGFEGVFQGHQTVGNLNRVTNAMSVGVVGVTQ